MQEALTYQDNFGYQSAMLESGQVNAKLQRELSNYLSQWLTNLAHQQGNQIKKTD
jgi:hypothetical protein